MVALIVEPQKVYRSDPTRITFGSGWPYASKQRAVEFTRRLEAYSLSNEQRYAIYRGNTQALFPRLASASAKGA